MQPNDGPEWRGAKSVEMQTGPAIPRPLQAVGSAKTSPEPPPRLPIWYLSPFSSGSTNPFLRNPIKTNLCAGGMVNKLQQLGCKPKCLSSSLEVDVQRVVPGSLSNDGNPSN